jgi:hypothetical protein
MKLTHQTYLSRVVEPPADATPLRKAFGAEIDSRYAEVFPVSQISPMTLRDYLVQSQDVPAATLARDAARLDSLSGDVVVLAPRAVEGVEALSPRPELTHIGSYLPAEADTAARPLPRATTAESPQIATPAASTGTPLQKKTILLTVVGALALVVILALLLS